LLSPLQFYAEWVHKGWYSGPFPAFIPRYLQSLGHEYHGTVSPRIFESFGSHLWFLGYLFSFSLLALPLCLWLKKDAGQRTIGWLGGLGQKRGGLLVFVIPLVLARLSLQPAYAGYTDWADFAYMLVYFLYGFVLYADERFTMAIKRDARLMLAVGMCTTLIMIGTVIAGVAAEWATTPGTPGFHFAWATVVVNGWCWTTFVLYLGMRFLNSRNKWLAYGQEAILPFYLFHQPVIVAIAFFVVQWDIAAQLGPGVDILVKLPTVVLGSFAVTLGLYEVLRRIPPARALLGMKPRKHASPQFSKTGSRREAAAGCTSESTATGN
jgi:surface polysaccharide O-acyltransferase-like enzyme